MTAKLVVGTIRGQIGNRFVVVSPDGSRNTFVIESVQTPKIGVDIIGMLDTDAVEPKIRLVPDVTRAILSGRSAILVGGRPEITARLLARALQGTGPGNIRPGTGGMIERSPQSDDPDVAWAMALVAAEADRAGIALNVIDPMAMAASEWDDRILTDTVLPADIAGERGALHDLKNLLNSGLRPACRRTIETIGRGNVVSSVDFVMPYSPFATGMTWSAEIGGAARNEIAVNNVWGEDARRISTFRELSLAFVPRYLGKVREHEGAAGHIEAAFADVSAVLAYGLAGGDMLTALKFQRLREAALARWNGHDEAPPATGLGIAEAIRALATQRPRNSGELFTLAAQIAKATAPGKRADLEVLRANSTADRVFVDLDTASEEILDLAKKMYRKDLEGVVERLRHSDRAIDRMSRFGTYSVPAGLEDVFDEIVAPEGPGAALEFPDDPWTAREPVSPRL